ncbi:MAG: DUF11 domain-containing protein, partial [Xanthomonadales bacterium]|nr:DUF11 domain-containing protein [Xanthomonadales bacterium]
QVFNDGPSAATNVQVTDVPTNLTITNVSGACAALPCTIATLASGASATITVTATINASGAFDNSATATGAEHDPTPGNNTDNTGNGGNAAASADVRVVKTLDTAGPYVAGQTVSYTLQVFNDGPSAATNVQVTDVPTNLTITNVSGACAALPCTIATLASGAGATITVTATITASGAFDNSATATGAENDPTPGNNTDDTGNGGVSFIPSLSLDKSAGAPVDVNGNGITDAGDTIAYTFVVTNTGGVPLTAVVVNDSKLSGVPIPCTPATIPVGGTANCGPVTYVVTAADVAVGTVHNSATATGTPPGGVPPVASDPDTTDTPTTAPVPSLASNKVMAGYDDADGSGSLSLGDVMHYTVTVTNTGNVPLQNVVVSDARLTPASVTCPVVPVAGTCVLAGTSLVTQADVDAGQALNTAIVTTGSIPGGGTLPPESCPAGSTNPVCSPSTSSPIIQHPAIATLKVATLTVDNRTPGVANAGDVITYTVTATNVGNVTLTNVTVVDTLDGYAPTTLTCTPTTLAPGQTAACASYSHTVTVADAARPGGLLNNQVVASGNSVGGASVTVTALGNAAVMLEPDPVQIRVVKTSSQHDVKIGDLVRYTLTIQNTGTMPLVGGTIVDTPPPGFTYVDGSLAVDDDNDAGLLTSTYPIAVDQIDVGVDQTATVQYLLRVGAGVRGGAQTNTVQIQDHGKVVSNVATAVVQLTADPMLDESLILGTVFDDRDGDGWQDSAALSDVRVQGGFAPGAYVPNSTTLDRGDGEKAEPDASAPLLHGIAVGALSGRESDGDPAAKHRVVISQVLSTLEFTGDFVLTSAEGLTVRMDAAGNTTTERSGKAARGLTAGAPTVRRSISQVANGYRVDYVIENAGVDERGIPGVRIASVEGLLVETDQYGRYHLTGVDGGRWERGRNFILKVDPATLPPGSVLTTENPLVRRVTPGLPVRFDFGVKLPDGQIQGTTHAVELELGTVLFDPDSATLRSQYLPVIDAMAAQIRENGAGEVVLTATGETQALAYDRAKAVREALIGKLDPALAQAMTISVRTDPADAGSTLLTLGASPVLGTVLFATDSAEIRAEYRQVIDKVAADIEAMGGGVVGVVGHADRRGSDAYNVALGLRRAKAVYEAIAQRLSPQARNRLRVEISADPTAPVGRTGR